MRLYDILIEKIYDIEQFFRKLKKLKINIVSWCVIWHFLLAALK